MLGAWRYDGDVHLDVGGVQLLEGRRRLSKKPVDMLVYRLPLGWSVHQRTLFAVSHGSSFQVGCSIVAHGRFQGSGGYEREYGERLYTGHALDKMQERGIMPSVVDDAIAHGRMTKARGGRIKYYDKKNNISVITEGDGRVVTVRYGS